MFYMYLNVSVIVGGESQVNSNDLKTKLYFKTAVNDSDFTIKRCL